MTCSPRLASLVPLVALVACGGPDPKAGTPPSDPRVVSVGKVSLRTGGGLAASGQLVAREDVAVSADVSGYRVDRVLVEEDAVVRRGQVLAVLDPALLAPQLAQANARLGQQQVAAERARAEAARVSGLDGKGVLSDEAIAERRLAVRAGATQVAAARAEVDNLRVQRARLTVRAPRDGRVLQRNVRPGDTAQAGTVMFTMARDDLVELEAELPEAAAGRVRIGTHARIETADGTTFDGRVRLIGARVDPQSGTVKVRIALPIDPSLRPGGFAKATFTEGAGTSPAVPESAIRYGTSGASVQTVSSDNRVRTTRVRTGDRSNGQVFLQAGPPVGTSVVLSGGTFLSDGDRITPVTAMGRP